MLLYGRSTGDHSTNTFLTGPMNPACSRLDILCEIVAWLSAITKLSIIVRNVMLEPHSCGRPSAGSGHGWIIADRSRLSPLTGSQDWRSTDTRRALLWAIV